jgi:nucleoside-diphosphate-sugar epimerase
MKILVTGGLGFIGSHTVVELQKEGFEVVIIDDLSNSSINVSEGITAITGKTPIFEQLDLKEKDKVEKFFNQHKDIVGVIHFAASNGRRAVRPTENNGRKPDEDRQRFALDEQRPTRRPRRNRATRTAAR